MRGKAKVSIIVPVYNSTRYLAPCLDSILDQSHDHLEIILVNDGSTDHSLSLCRRYEAADSRVRVLDQDNRGVAWARNRGLTQVTGDYVGFVDGDDRLAPDMYEKLLDALQAKGADLAECAYVRVDDQGQKVRAYPVPDRELEGRQACSRALIKRDQSYPSCCNKLYRADLIRGLTFPLLRYSEDFLFNVQSLLRCQKSVGLSTCGYYYRDHGGGATQPAFKPAKMDILDAGQEALALYSRELPDLLPYARLYLLDNARLLYWQADQTDRQAFQPEKARLVASFGQHYPAIQKDLAPILPSRRKRRLLALFYRNPKLYVFLKKVSRSGRP